MIYFKGAKEARSVKQLLNIGFKSQYYARGSLFKQTYFDEACTNEECHSARRSFNDLYEIVTTYFPSTSRKKFAFILLSLNNIICFICNDINKLVFLKEINFHGIFEDRIERRYTSDYKDSQGICFNDIKALAENYKK